jgi:hypothetical protein
MNWRIAADSLLLLRALVAVLFACSMAGFVLTMVFGFEEPNEPLLLASSGLLLTAIAAVFAHLGFTRTLNRPQKRIWLRLLTGRRAASAWSEYLSCDDLAATAGRLGEQVSARR